MSAIDEPSAFEQFRANYRAHALSRFVENFSIRGSRFSTGIDRYFRTAPITIDSPGDKILLLYESDERLVE